MNSKRPLANVHEVGSSASVCENHLYQRVPTRPVDRTLRNLGKTLRTKDPPKTERTFGAIAKGRSKTPGGRELPGVAGFVAQGEEHLFKGDIENYILGQQIGQGAYAAVRLSTQKSTNSKVAIKVYDKVRIAQPHRRRNLIREIEIMQKLAHPNCVKMVEAINAGKQVFLVMEYVAGESLHAHLKQRPMRRMEESEARGIFQQVVSGLEYCHSLAISHRDIKLENIILDDMHTVKIIDFGFSTVSEATEKAKIFCGTPSYMAPEIVQRKEYCGQPADVWALGVLLFALLCGTFPFRGLSDKELYGKIAKGLFSVPHCVSPHARSLIHALLAVEPAKRPTCSEILKHEWLTPPLQPVDTNVQGTSEERKELPQTQRPRKSLLSELFKKYQITRRPEGGFTYTKMHVRISGKENHL